MLGPALEGMDPICSLRSIHETPPRFLDCHNVPRTQMVDHVTSGRVMVIDSSLRSV